MPLRNAQAKLAVLHGLRRPRGARARSRPRRARSSTPTGSSCLRASEELAAELLGHRRRRRAQRGGEGHLAPRALARARSAASDDSAPTLRRRCASAGSSGCSAPSARTIPSSYHTAYMRRLSPLESTYTKDRATEVCLADARRRSASTSNAQPNIKLDLDDRPQKSPRACVIASDPPKRRAPDHARAGRPARLPGVPARGRPRAALRRLRPEPAVHLPPHLARPRADRDLLVHRRGDLARARLARAVLRPLRRAGAARTPRRRRSSRRCSTAATRRSSASSSTSGRASPTTAATPDGYERVPDRGDRHPLPRATTTSPTWTPASTRPTTCAPGSAPRSCASTSSSEVGERLVAQPEDGRAARATLFREGTKPTSEEIAARLGFDPLDTKPLLHEIGA